MREYQLSVAGTWKKANGPSFDSFNPYTSKPWARISEASEQDVQAAVDAANDCFEKKWRHTSGFERARLMLKLAELVEGSAERLATLESTDNGKIIRETRGQVIFMGRQLRFFAGFADKLWGKNIPLDQRDVADFTSREPIGVAAVITAWNSPIALLANKLAPALAVGCCIVVKPSEHASVTTLEFAELVKEAGFPDGVFNVVTGYGETGRALVNARGIGRVSFTGSPGVGREIAAAAGRRLVPVTMELGGKSANIIFSDADIDRAVVGAMAGIFGATGQTCIAGSRLLVHESIQREVVEKLVQRTRGIKLGNPLDLSTEMGTVANEAQFNRILDHIRSAQDEGAVLATGGKKAAGEALEQGLFVEPTIFSGVRNGMKLAQEEIFGPVLAVIPFSSDEEAVKIANDSRFGLAAGVWSRDVNRILRVCRELRVGTIWVNTYRSVAAQAPFGGVKESGFGRERGEEALLEYLTTKNVMINFSEEARDPFAVKA